MKEPVWIRKLADRYLVVDSSGNCVDSDNIGFSTEDAARRWAEANGYEIVEEQ